MGEYVDQATSIILVVSIQDLCEQIQTKNLKIVDSCPVRLFLSLKYFVVIIFNVTFTDTALYIFYI